MDFQAQFIEEMELEPEQIYDFRVRAENNYDNPNNPDERFSDWIVSDGVTKGKVNHLCKTVVK